MLKIETPNGRLKLSADIEIPLTITNPMFADRGSYSLPFTTPLKPNKSIIGNPRSLKNKSFTSQFLDVVISHKGFKEKGMLEVTDFSDNEVEFSLTTKEGAFWEWAKKTKLTELDFPSGDPFTGTASEKFDEWEQRLIDSNDKSWPEEYFKVFPVVVDWEVDSENPEIWGTDLHRFKFLNEIDALTGEFLFTRNLNSLIDVSPFLYHNAIIFLIASKYGLKVDNELVTIPEMNRACLVNNATMCFINGTLTWNELVPDISILEYIESIEAFVGAVFYTNFKTKTLKVILADTILKQSSIKKINGNVKLKPSIPIQITLKSEKGNDDFSKVIEQTDEYLQNTLVTYTETELVKYNNQYVAESNNSPTGAYTRIAYIKAAENYFFRTCDYIEGVEWPYKIVWKFKGNRLRDYEPETNLEKKDFNSKIVVLPMIAAFIMGYILPGYDVIFNYLLPLFKTKLKDFVTDEYEGGIYDDKPSFPLNVCIYRGKYKNAISEEFYNYYFPWASSFTYTALNEPLNNLPVEQDQLLNDTLSLIKQGREGDNIGIYDRFWKRVEQLYLNSAKEVDITNVKVEDILKNNIWDVFDIDGNHIIFTEIKLTLKLNSIVFDSAKGITTKPYV